MLLAVIDLGSNSFRLEIGRAGSHAGGRIEPVDSWKETVRLARGLDDEGRLSHQAIDAACACLARMNARMRGFAPQRVRAVGTQTLREARNLDEFLRKAQTALGYPIEVISGREEARLIFEGCMRGLPPAARPRLVVDIGGASTEVIVGRGLRVDAAESFRIGGVNTTDRYFGHGRIDPASFEAAVQACAAELEAGATQARQSPFLGAPHLRWSEVYGAGGAINAIARALRDEGWTRGAITVDGLAQFRRRLLEFREIGKIAFARMKSERQEVIAGGAAVLTAVFETLGIRAMHPSRGGLRTGVLYDLLDRQPIGPLEAKENRD
jgi:exopolyphosphatase/guanosine-5'-triphosphate,3'-diphosphate pyrophosphatase